MCVSLEGESPVQPDMKILNHRTDNRGLRPITKEFVKFVLKKHTETCVVLLCNKRICISTAVSDTPVGNLHLLFGKKVKGTL